jgi:hypothetical protein
MKVFCQSCKHFWSSTFCAAPSNVKDTWFGPNSAMILTPEEKNKNNDCPDYIDKKLAERKEQLQKEIEIWNNKKWWQFWK